jgi:hypothetical protein
MAGSYIKATRVVNTMLGLLVREATLPQLVWRNPVGDFAGAFNDTVSIRLPAFATARTRTLRSGASRTKDNLYERKIDLTLDTDIYMDVPITDEELTLDIADFGAQVLNPVANAIVRKYEDLIASEITGASYDETIAYVSSTDDPYEDVAVPARLKLNQAYVPLQGRVLVVGSDLEAAFLRSPNFVRASWSGTTQTLREAQIGRVAGFDVYGSPAIPADEGYAFHQTAFALSSRAPVVPAGCSWGAIGTYGGFAIRTVRNYDSDAVEDRFLADAWAGTAPVTDIGHYDADPAEGGKFVPVTDPANPVSSGSAWQHDSARLVRAVKITVS